MALEKGSQLPSISQCSLGAAIAGGMAYGAYILSLRFVAAFSKPLAMDDRVALNIAVAVRTLIVGIAFLATGICTIVAVGLVILAIYVAFDRQPKPSE
jgi:hypothetical protein